MERYSVELWVVIQILIDLILIVTALYLIKNVKKTIQGTISEDAAEKTIALLEPLLKEADSVSKTFGDQLKKKNELIANLNEKLDSRIISLTLLLNRAELELSMNSESASSKTGKVYDHNEAIAHLHMKGYDADHIARKLSIPKGEVDLVIDLKNRLLAVK